ncbi:RNA helicase Mov10l1 isoform X5 [Narcine bancroftii]|uniref:RNA helicase Mov10l1 isoform X5 n=1 Tax=Narcine bancroftii TaxID=1343680 RepID=UPI00383110FE
MFSLLLKAATFLWRKDDDDDLEQDKYEADCAEHKNVLGGTVTRSCGKYGLIDDSIYFTSNDVLGGVPLQIGQKVNVLAQKNEPCGGWKAIKVQLETDHWDEGGSCTVYSDSSDQMKTHSLIGMITSCNNDGGYINETTHFTMDNVCEGFQPFVGDWIQAQYFIEQTTWKSQASCVKPLRYKRVDKVPITRMLHGSGVVDDVIFFTLESLQLPPNYIPRKDDVVNLVIVESSQSLYQWRALCIAPEEKESFSVPSINNKNPEQIDLELFSNKGGLEVTNNFDFGTMKYGERKVLMMWIENKGNETQTLLRYSLAGWERASQFSFESPRMVPATSSSESVIQQQQSLVEVVSSCNITRFQSLSKDIGSPVSSTTVQTGSKSPFVTKDYTREPTPCEITSDQDLAHSSESAGGNRLKNLPPSMGNRASCPGSSSAVEKIRLHINTDTEMGEGPQQIPAGEKVCINLTCEAKNPGRCRDLLLLYFDKFVIGRYLVVDVINDEETLLAPASQYNPIKHRFSQVNQKETIATIIHVQNPKRLLRRHVPNFLPQYPIPEQLKKCFDKDADILAIQPSLAEPLNMLNYKDNFSALVWLEEINAEQEMREFDMTAAVLKKYDDFLILQMAGLAERRPSLFIGDRILLKNRYCAETEVLYCGIVTKVYDDEVMLKVNSEFQQIYEGEPLDVEFTYNRVSARRCHFAVEQALCLGEAVLFPDKVLAKSPLTVTTWNDIHQVMRKGEKCFRSPNQAKNGKDTIAELTDSCTGKGNSRKYTGDTDARKDLQGEPSNQKECNFYNLQLNEHQRSAVIHIVRGECRPTPYIVFGPPGTGKTVTILEAILQIYFTLPDSRILATAPSNSAADLLCLRLHESSLLKQGDMYIPEIVQLYSKDGEDLWDASRCRIIISTCSTAGLFFQIGLRTGHFTHVFVDEAGQASEPECLIPLLLVSEKDGQIVLAGDPMQLGPIIKSRIATTYGLSISFLERLMTQSLYSRDDAFCAFGSYNPLLVTKLVNNYRSHSSLLHLPSKLFYHNELKMSMDQSVANTFCNWEKLPKKGFPIIFHALRGDEMREANNPSWFNPKEAVQVVRYCCLLAKLCTSPVQPCDIGIITPYQKQVQKIRVLLRSVNLEDIKVGSVEEFQGQEKMVIIVSTVRSNEENLYEDVRNVLGFLSNPKRFNVAITRAKALLILVGNPHVLLKDPCWAALLEYCISNDAYTGCNLPSELLSLTV